MLKKTIEYIKDSEFRATLFHNRLNIVNYLDIIIMESARITIKHDKGLLKVIGNNLSINKLLEQELLITGEIKNVELGWYNVS